MRAATMFGAATNESNTDELVNDVGGVTVDIFGVVAGVDNKNTIMGG